MVKEFLSKRGISFQERDVAKNQSYAQELVNTTGQMGVPVTIINGQAVIGFDRAGLEQALTRTESQQRPKFGAFIADAGKITAQRGMVTTLGAYIDKVRPGSLANRIGLVSGDIITELNMRRIANASDLEQALASLNKGSRFSVVLLRENETLTTEGIF